MFFLYFFILLLFINCLFVSGNEQFLVTAQLLNCLDPPKCSSPSRSDCKIKNKEVATQTLNSKIYGASSVKICMKKILIRIEIDNAGKVCGDDEFVVVDDVLDPITKNASQLLNPIILQLRRKQPQIVFPLTFQQVVNGGAYEEMVFGNDSDVCTANVCGVSNYDRSSIPFSEGFCCLCSSGSENRKPKRSPTSSGLVFKEPSLFTLPQSNYDEENNVIRVQSLTCPTVIEHKPLKNHLPQFFFELDEKILNQYCTSSLGKKHYKGSIETLPNINESKRRRRQQERLVAKLSTHHAIDKKLVKRFARSMRAQINNDRLSKVMKKLDKNMKLDRQMCTGNSTSSTSAHCLRFSDVWYSVYTFGAPSITQEVTVQVLQKKDGADGSSYWVDLTRGNLIKLGSNYVHAEDGLPTIAFSYSSLQEGGGLGASCPIDFESRLLLVPSHIQQPAKFDLHPEAQGGPAEYLVVGKDDVSTDGKDCDRIGTSFEGFANQPNRCDKPQGTCLNKQPVDLWIKDMENQVNGQKGKYFLENYGTVASTSLTSDQTSRNEDPMIALEFTAAFRSLLQIEIVADSNALIRSGWNIKIESAIADSSSPERTTLSILVLSENLVSGQLRPWLVDCSTALPPGAVAHGPATIISPLQRHMFQVIMEGSLPTTSMTCTVEIHNELRERVASRLVTIKKQTRCVCAFHCSCACLVAGSRLPCSPLMQEEYVAAGYRGGLPRTAGIPPQVPFEMAPYNIVVSFIFATFLFGKAKVALGCCSEKIRKFGLGLLRDRVTRLLTPILGQERTVDLLRRVGAEICMNMFFFVLFPIFMLLKLLSYCCCTHSKREKKHTKPKSPDEYFIMERSDSSRAEFSQSYPREEEDSQYIRSYMSRERDSDS